MRILAFMLSHDQLTNLLYCLSDETRLRILNLLIHHKKPLVQRDIEKTLQVTQTKIARHFLYMRQRDIVSFEKHYQFVYFSVHPDFRTIIKYIISKSDSGVLLADVSRFEEIKKDLYLQKHIK